MAARMAAGSLRALGKLFRLFELQPPMKVFTRVVLAVVVEEPSYDREFPILNTWEASCGCTCHPEYWEFSIVEKVFNFNRKRTL